MIATGEEFLVVKARASAALNGCEPASLVHGPEITRDDSRFVDMAMCRTSGGRDRVRVDPSAAKAVFLAGFDGGAEAPPLQMGTPKQIPGNRALVSA
jgi:hypothetical protein